MSFAVTYFHVDAFAERAFQGNPAAVCVLQGTATLWEDAVLARIASELNLSETAFVYHTQDVPLAQGTEFRLRWFTPTVEVALCGHATLASAHVLFNHCACTAEAVTFHTKSGPLVVQRGAGNGDGGKRMLSMQFPAYPPVLRDEWKHSRDPIVTQLIERVVRVAGSTGVARVTWVGAVDSVYYAAGTKKLFVVLKPLGGEELLSSLTPDIPGMLALDQRSVPEASRITGVAVTVQASPQSEAQGYAFASRYFSPWNGIPEDPVNGSSHTSLGPLWAKRLDLWPSFECEPVVTLKAKALSARGGTLHVSVVPQEGGEKVAHVLLAGTACTVAEGTLRVSL